MYLKGVCLRETKKKLYTNRQNDEERDVTEKRKREEQK